jgi:hypothetical protein
MAKATETQDDREAAISKAHSALNKAKTVEQLREVWKEHFPIIGHRILGRLLIGQDVESASRRKRSE